MGQVVSIETARGRHPETLVDLADNIATAAKRLRKRFVKIESKSATAEDYSEALLLMNSIARSIQAMVPKKLPQSAQRPQRNNL